PPARNAWALRSLAGEQPRTIKLRRPSATSCCTDALIFPTGRVLHAGARASWPPIFCGGRLSFLQRWRRALRFAENNRARIFGAVPSSHLLPRRFSQALSSGVPQPQHGIANGRERPGFRHLRIAEA